MWRQKAPGKHDGGCESIVFFRTDTPTIRSHTDDTRVHTDRHHASATINVSSSRSPPRHLLPSLPLPYAASLSSWASWIPAYAGDLLLLSLRESFSIRSKDFFFSSRVDRKVNHNDDWIGQNSEFIWEFLCVWKCISQFCSKKNLKLGILDFGFEFEGILVSCRIFFFFFCVRLKIDWKLTRLDEIRAHLFFAGNSFNIHCFIHSSMKHTG